MNKLLIISLLSTLPLILFPPPTQAEGEIAYDCKRNVTFLQTGPTEGEITFDNIPPGLSFEVRRRFATGQVVNSFFQSCSDRMGSSHTATITWPENFTGSELLVVVDENPVIGCAPADLTVPEWTKLEGAGRVCKFTFDTTEYDPNNPPSLQRPYDATVDEINYEDIDFNICTQANVNQLSDCQTCFENKSVWTAIGCIPATPAAFAGTLIQFAIGIAGGIALLLMLYGVLILTTAGGNPEKIQGGRETITAALTGLLVIIFASVLLQFIGVEILDLPGL